ncbi:MAG: cell division protein FtsK [Acidimicrobiales bacterium]|nr:MAG: cell division protein FtsK [Acidimicrobiales bacterium]
MSDDFVVTLVADLAEPRNIQLSIPGEVTGESLFSALDDRVGAASSVLWNDRTGQAIERRGTTVVDLRHGDTVRTAGPGARWQPFHLDETGGGARHSFGATTTIGRSAAGTGSIRLADPTVSSTHARIVVEAGRTYIEDANSKNGTFLNGSRVTGREPLRDGDEVDLGSNSQFRFSIDESGAAPPASRASLPRAGHAAINRPPRTVVASPAGTTRISGAPPARRNRRFPWASLVIPIAGGVVMAVILDNARFLIFAAMGPAMAIWNFVEGRSDESRQHAAAVEAFRSSLAAVTDELQQAAIDSAAWFHSVLPDRGDIVRRVRTTIDLWDRGPAHEDFGWVRVGHGPRAPLRVVDVDERGDDTLVAAAVALRDAAIADSSGPHHVSLLSEAVIGVVGRGELVDEAVAGLVIRLAARHSPTELCVCALTANPDHRWMRWLPHTRSVPGLDAAAGAESADQVRSIFAAVEELVDRRLAGDDQALGSGAVPLPHIVLLVSPPAPVPTASLAALMDRAGAAGVSVVYVAPTEAALPGGCRAILDIEGTPVLRRPAANLALPLTSIERIPLGEAALLAREMAGLVDSTAGGAAAAIPTAVSLCDVNGIDASVDAAVVTSRWRESESQLSAPIGRTGDSVVDLGFASTREGPHVLVAGTTRAGKSEFLQALVAGLALRHPPEELNLLYVDWKGAATFRPFMQIPHAVGLLSDLDEGLADRALRSLQAELDHRKRVLDETGVQKFEDLPRGALPRLVVLFDEFAELVDNNKEFSEGVITVAQVGGSLGVHMVLAMQTPSAALSKRVENCINGRVVFRLKDRAESGSALGSPKAAEISASIPGRGYLRDGSNRVVEFQSAYGGAVSGGDDTEVSAHTVGAEALERALAGGPTDLEALVAAIEAAAPNGFAARPPWVAPLPTTLSLDELATDGLTHAAVGLIDDPEQQTTRPYELDLVAIRNLLIAGAGATGRTSALRTIIDSLARTSAIDELAIYGIDFAGDLRSTTCVPHVGDVIQGDDPDKLRRLMTMLRLEVNRRRDLVLDGGSYRDIQKSRDGLPTIVVVIDGLGPLVGELADLDHQEWTGSLQALMSEGPGVGIHVVAATDDPMLRTSTMTLFGERLVLPQTMKEGYSNLGVANIPVTSRSPGRAISSNNRLEMQFALSAEPGASEPSEQVAAMNSRWIGARSIARPIDVLPVELPRSTLEEVPTEGLVVAMGLDDAALEPQLVDFSRQPTLLIAGPDVSGRTTTIEWVRRRLDAQGPLQSFRFLMSAATVGESGWTAEVRGSDAIHAALGGIAETPFAGTTLIAFDDADPLLELSAAATPEEREAKKILDEWARLLDRLLDEARDRSIVVVVAGRLDGLGRAQGWLKRARDAKQALVLSPAGLGSSSTDPMFAVKNPRRTGYSPRAGQGVLIRRTETCLIQVPWTGSQESDTGFG